MLQLPSSARPPGKRSPLEKTLDFCSLISATDHLGGPVSPVLGETIEAGKAVRLPDSGDDPWLCNMFGLRAEI